MPPPTMSADAPMCLPSVRSPRLGSPYCTSPSPPRSTSLAGDRSRIGFTSREDPEPLNRTTEPLAQQPRGAGEGAGTGGLHSWRQPNRTIPDVAGTVSSQIVVQGPHVTSHGAAHRGPAQSESPVSRGFLPVEVTGFEPVTPSLRTKCSAGLSYTPAVGEIVGATWVFSELSAPACAHCSGYDSDIAANSAGDSSRVGDDRYSGAVVRVDEAAVEAERHLGILVAESRRYLTNRTDSLSRSRRASVGVNVE